MTTTPKAKPATKAPATDTPTPTVEDKPKRTTVSAMGEAPRVLEALKKAGKDGLTLKALQETTGLSYRVLHNIGWRLEGSPEVRDQEKLGQLRKPDEKKIERVGRGRTVTYAII